MKKGTKKLLIVWMMLGATPAFATPDPYEEANRLVHGFNQTLRAQVLAPLAEAWRERVPVDIRIGLGRAAANLAEPITAASGLAAGDTGLAWHALTRFGINSTLGYGGYRDHAAGLGYEPRRFDLADAFCAWGVPSGPYLVLPLVGPTTLREAGAAVLTAGLLSHGVGAEAVLAWNTTSGLLSYAELHPALTQMDAAALDPYTTQRSAYAQRRAQTCAEGED